MIDSDTQWALGLLGRRGVVGRRLAGSRSGAGVFAVAVDEGDAVLKVTRGSTEELTAGRRELEFYRTVAPTLPVRTPRLIDHVHTEQAVVILLAAVGPAIPAAGWDRSRWVRVAAELAAVHDAAVPDDPRWRRGSWLLDAIAQPDRAHTDFWAGPGDEGVLAPVLGDLRPLGRVMSAQSPCLVHGDCHTDNLLRGVGSDDDSIVWVDWTSAGLGLPAEDLAFLSVRAVPDGAALPREAMLSAYAGRRNVALEPLRAAVLATELAFFLLAWPEFAVYTSARGVARVRRRVHELARAWADQ